VLPFFLLSLSKKNTPCLPSTFSKAR